MLILNRRKDQVITIGEDITITVCEIDRGKVAIGITAPDDVPVHRLEVKQKIDAVKKRPNSEAV